MTRPQPPFEDSYDPYAPHEPPDPYASNPSAPHPSAPPYPRPSVPAVRPPGPPYPPPRPTNQNAIMAIIFGFVLGPLGIYFGNKAKREIASTGEDGETLATVGLIVGWIQTGLLAVVLLSIVVMFVIWLVYFLFIGVLLAGTAGSV